MSKANSPVTGKPYGLAAVCRAWRIARSGVYRHRTPPPPPRRRGPMGALSDAALTAAIQAVLAASPFHGEGHRKVWARLRHAGIRTSLRRVLRLMREHDLLAPGRVGSPRGPRSHDGTIIPETIDTMWGTDLTATLTGEGPARYSLQWIIVPPSASAFTPMREPHASRLWSRSVRACANTLAASRPMSRTASRCGTITVRNTCRTTSKVRSRSSASKAHPPSSVRPRETAVPSASSEL
jgi:HTH-like domain